VPVDCLTSEQKRSYGRYAAEPSVEQLAANFHLSDADRRLVDLRRGDHNRLGFGVQLGTVRLLGTFLSDPTDIPKGVARYVAKQLGVDASCLVLYSTRTATHIEHAAEIRNAYGYTTFGNNVVDSPNCGIIGAWKLLQKTQKLS
jgi:TnpA family transposase